MLISPRIHRSRIFPFYGVILWLVFAAFLPVSCAQAQGIRALDLKAGQFVYAVPPGFDPPYIGKNGLSDIERQARQLHFPYSL